MRLKINTSDKYPDYKTINISKKRIEEILNKIYKSKRKEFSDVKMDNIDIYAGAHNALEYVISLFEKRKPKHVSGEELLEQQDIDIMLDKFFKDLEEEPKVYNKLPKVHSLDSYNKDIGYDEDGEYISKCITCGIFKYECDFKNRSTKRCKKCADLIKKLEKESNE